MSSAGGRLSRSSPKRIGSVDPYALKIPAPKGRNTHYRWNATSPLHAEPEQPHAHLPNCFGRLHLDKAKARSVKSRVAVPATVIIDDDRFVYRANRIEEPVR